MYIATVPNRNSPPAILLRESYREAGKVKTRTLANLSHLPPFAIATLRRTLKGEKLVSAADAFEIVASGSRSHGHVEAVLTAMRRLDFFKLIGSRSSRERDLVVAMVVARILAPRSKLSTTLWWNDTTLPEILGVSDADENELYGAMDWLLAHQSHIEKKLASRHLDNDEMALYDLTSSYFEGSTCPLAAIGYSRDGRKGMRQVNYGLLTNQLGIPVAVSVFKGNTGDPKTLLSQVDKMQKEFGIERFILVGDRGMLTQKQIVALRKIDGVDWIGALRPEAIRKLAKSGVIQMGLFDERNLFELEHPDFPDERLIACRNPELARRRAKKRQNLLEATTRELEKVSQMVLRGRLCGQDKIGVRVGKIINKYKVGKHFELDIRDETFIYKIDQAKVDTESALDGIYIIRTSLPEKRMSAAETVRSYKQLSRVERAFRSFKIVDLMVRPIRHRLEGRVRAHIFLCMLAYYVQWHMTEAWRPLLYADEDQEAKSYRDPVAPAKRSPEAMQKVKTKRLADGSRVHSLRSLLAHLGAIVRNTCRCSGRRSQDATFTMDTKPNPKQIMAFKLLEMIRL